MSVWILLLGCGWLAGTVSGAAGFGGALLLMPVLSFAAGARAVPILTVAQLLGNMARAGFGRRDIRWRPALLFGAGAVPASVLGALVFADLPGAIVLRIIGGSLILIVVARRAAPERTRVPERLLAPAGAVVGLLSGIAGSAGPLGAAVFLGLRLPRPAYVASEAVTAVLMHLTKSLVYGRYAALTRDDLLAGLALGAALALGAWTGRRLMHGLPEKRFAPAVEGLLVISGLSLIVGWAS